MKEEKPKKISPEDRLEMDVANFVQVALIERYLKNKLGPNFEKHEKKLDLEIGWIKDHREKFRNLFKKNKKLFVDSYQSNKDDLIDYVEKLMDGKE